MNYIFTTFSLLFLFTSLVSFAVAVIAWNRKRERGTTELAWLMLFAGLWSFFVIFETAATTIELKIFWSKVAYVGALTTPVLYLILVLRFVGKDKYLKKKYLVALWIVPIITFILTLTNEYHELVWTGYAPISPSTNLTQYYHGIAFWIGNVIYNYILLFITSAYLLTFIFERMSTFRTQGLYLLVGSLCPWIASVFYITAKNPVPGLDLVPQSMIFSGILFTIAIYRNRFLDLIPVAKETLFETLDEGIIVLDANNRVQDINDTARGFLGVESKNITGINIDCDYVKVKSFVSVIMSDQSESRLDVPGRLGVNSYLVLKKKFKDYPGSNLVIIRDITNEILKERQIKLSNENYQQLYNLFRMMSDNMQDMLWAKDLEKRYIFVNKSICNNFLFASDISEPIGKTDQYFFDREFAANHGNKQWHTFGATCSDSDQVVIETGEPARFEEEGYLRGSYFVMDVNKAPIFDSSGKMIGIVGSAREITQDKKNKEELVIAKKKAEESDTLKSSFLTNLSHEIRTPMNSITGFLELIQSKDINIDEHQTYIEQLKKSSGRILSTLNDIIEVSKIEAGQIQLDENNVNLNEILDYFISKYTSEAAERGLELIAEKGLDNNQAFVITDRNKLISILNNLIKNSIKYTYSGYIKIGYKHNEEVIDFYVEDTGIGIPKERQEVIFYRFVQADHSLTRPYEGSGIGLSIVKAYTELMGGGINLDSEPDKGSKFYFSLNYKPVIFPN
ncbi:MAG: hypothetical protein CVU12_05485 [Bacteroidetes bacterium HGW-Bacteroidetes-7]|jgi:signal transduction histidine kinase|nr:MAG: hypothetical protein CVU12_05485 [Bacteroidetes bacterium HGW-Bacteroidetes-7]